MRKAPVDIGLFTAAYIALPFVSFLLKHKGLKKTERFLSRRVVSDSGRSDDFVDRAALSVSRAAGYGPCRGKCLEQAFTLWWMLAFLGVDSRIRLGIYKAGEQFEAHAWVECRDRIVIGDEGVDRFEPLLDVTLERSPK